MNFFELIKHCVIGLALVAGCWSLPQERNATLQVVSIRKIPAACRVTLQLELPPSHQAEQLIDAGIPLTIRFRAIFDRTDTVIHIRTLRCDIADLTYTFADSSGEKVSVLKTYPMIRRALRDFSRCEFDLPHQAVKCRVEAEILPSRVSRLKRSVDMGRMWGCQRMTAFISL